MTIDPESPENPEMTLQAQMRQAMRRLGASVTVITSHDGTRRYAMTATAVTSLSLTPPALLVCVNRDSGLYQALAAGHGYCVNILHSDQQEIADRCAWKDQGENKFDVGDWRDGAEHTPYLADAQASLFCDLAEITLYGSHAVCIGQVRRILIRDEIAPLLFLDGTYFAPPPRPS